MSKAKTLLITGLFTLIAASPLSAQLSILNVGGVLGMNIASIGVTDAPSDEEYSSRLGIIFGAIAEATVSNSIGVSVELIIIGKGAVIKESGDKVNFNLSYIELPIMVRYNFETSGTAEPFVMAGPSIGFLTGAKVKFEDGDSYDIKHETKGIDFGFGIGGGVKVPQEKFTPFATLRYVFGFTNVNKEADESKVKNRGLQIAVGATVPIAVN